MTGPVKITPPRRTGGHKQTLHDLLKKCMDGDWWMVKKYKVASTAYAQAYHLKPGGKSAHLVPEGRWEFRSAAIPDSKPPAYGVWARYLGPKT